QTQPYLPCYRPGAPRELPSFPTRRSSDLGQPLDFIPGQFIQVHFQYADGTPTRRSYSLATIHDHALGPGDAVEIAVSYVAGGAADRKSTRLNSSHVKISYAVFCLKKKSTV